MITTQYKASVGFPDRVAELIAYDPEFDKQLCAASELSIEFGVSDSGSVFVWATFAHRRNAEVFEEIMVAYRDSLIKENER